MKRYQVVNHAMNRETLLAVPEQDDENSIHRYNKSTEENIQNLREKANIEVKEL